VGETETTKIVGRYEFPNYPHIILWDLPGVGTMSHPAKTYFDDKTMFAMDCIVITCSDRISEIDLEIASQAKEWDVPVFFVRGKADAALDAKRRRYKGGADVKKMLRDEIIQSIVPQLQIIGLEDRKVYIISAWKFSENEMDEEALVRDIVSTGASRQSS